MALKHLVILFILIFWPSVWCVRTFAKGRRSGGNVGTSANYWSASPVVQPITSNWFNQNLDHFDPSNDAKFKQRYYMNKSYYQNSGPMFLMVSGEGMASTSFVVKGEWIDIAKQNNALCFLLEHRYYGMSQPTPDVSVENLQYLSIEQALADTAHFIESMNKEYNVSPDQKWILFGGSYAGALVAWMRYKYPHLVYGVVSSSGPVQATVDFIQYYEVVTRSLSQYSTACVQEISNAFKQMEQLVSDPSGQQFLDYTLQLCSSLQTTNSSLDIANLFDIFASNFANVVQYNTVNNNSIATISNVCNIMTNTYLGDPINRLAAVNGQVIESSNFSCVDYAFSGMMSYIKKTTWQASAVQSGDRQYTYQTCSELGYFQTSENTTSIFGNKFKLNYFMAQCVDTFGPVFNNKNLQKTTARTNQYYGGNAPTSTNVLYIQGSNDPWQALGITYPATPNLNVIYIEGTAHCTDMYEAQPTDSPSLKAARNQIQQYVRNLLLAARPTPIATASSQISLTNILPQPFTILNEISSKGNAPASKSSEIFYTYDSTHSLETSQELDHSNTNSIINVIPIESSVFPINKFSLVSLPKSAKVITAIIPQQTQSATAKKPTNMGLSLRSHKNNPPKTKSVSSEIFLTGVTSSGFAELSF